MHGFRRGVAARVGVAANEFRRANRAVDRLEGAGGVLRQHLREAARGLFGGGEGGVVARVEIEPEHRAAPDDDKGGKGDQHVVWPARQIFADHLNRRADTAHAHRFPRKTPMRGGRCAHG